MRNRIGPVSRAAIAMAAALLAPASLGAQAGSAPVTPTPTPREGTVGPEQLRGFSLPGTVTRPTAPATTPPAATPPAPAAQRPPASASTASRSRQPATAGPSTAARIEPSLPPTLAPAPATTTGAPNDLFGSQPGTAGPIIMPTAPVPEADGAAQWPWLLAALLLAGLSGFAFWRQRSSANRRLVPAGVPDETAFRAPSPPQPRPAPPPRATGPSGGVVATRLRPWIDYEFMPERAVVTAEGVVIHFELVLVNSGNAPARDVRVEARMINAGDEQDKEIAGFFGRPLASAEAIDLVAPLSRVSRRASVVMPRDALREFAVEGRRLFVPLVAFNGEYRWASGGGQSAAAFLVGRGGEEDAKLGPMRLDLGPRLFRGLAARRLPLAVRS